MGRISEPFAHAGASAGGTILALKAERDTIIKISKRDWQKAVLSPSPVSRKKKELVL
jgi:hypothetical protein